MPQEQAALQVHEHPAEEGAASAGKATGDHLQVQDKLQERGGGEQPLRALLKGGEPEAAEEVLPADAAGHREQEERQVVEEPRDAAEEHAGEVQP